LNPIFSLNWLRHPKISKHLSIVQRLGSLLMLIQILSFVFIYLLPSFECFYNFGRTSVKTYHQFQTVLFLCFGNNELIIIKDQKDQ
jgi:hypothetical protein